MGADVSVIVPSYNQAAYLPDALTSLLNQTFTNWECIIIDDGSTDNTADVADVFVKKDSRFTYYCIENSGPSNARNVGILNARGQYILPLDGDDKISPNYIDECFKVLNSSEKVKLVYGAGVKFGVKNEKWQLKTYSYDALLLGNLIHPCGMYRKADWEMTGGYDTNMHEGLEDWEFWINLLTKDDEVIMLPGITFYWRIKEVSRTTLLNTGKKVAKMNRYVYCKHADLYINYFDDPIKLYTEYLPAATISNYASKHSFRFFCWSQWKKIKTMISKTKFNF